MSDLTHRVERGAALLDARKPGWDQVIDLVGVVLPPGSAVVVERIDRAFVSPLAIHAGDCVIVGHRVVSIDSEPVETTCGGVRVCRCERTVLTEDYASVHGAGRLHGVIDLPVNELVQVCRRGGAA